MYTPFRLIALTIVVAALLATVTTARAAVTAQQRCLSGRNKAAAAYASCHEKVKASVQINGDFPKFEAGLSKCRVKYATAWTKLQAKAFGTGSTCDGPRYIVSGGAVTDNLTGLQWEQKTDDASVHDKDNTYTWTATVLGSAADGTAYTMFLATLNSGGCFAGQCDWRLPTLQELEAIVLEATPCTTSPCIDQVAFGPTVADDYWTATNHFNATSLDFAWTINFASGALGGPGKDNPAYVRAVRGDL